LNERALKMCGIASDTAKGRKIRPHRMIVTGEVLWLKKHHKGTEPRPLVKEPGKWHIVYVFQVPHELAADREIIFRLRARCDHPVSWPADPLCGWHFVNTEMVHGYKCGPRLQNNEVALLVQTRWWIANLVTGFRVPRSAFYIELGGIVDPAASGVST